MTVSVGPPVTVVFEIEGRVRVASVVVEVSVSMVIEVVSVIVDVSVMVEVVIGMGAVTVEIVETPMQEQALE